MQRQHAIAAAPVYLKGRLQQDEALPAPELAPQRGDERMRATVAFVLGLEEGGVGYAGLPREVYVDLLGYLLPAWVDKGRARRRRQQQPRDARGARRSAGLWWRLLPTCGDGWSGRRRCPQ